jgi:crotonobetainyl-CoA:carnitine CoA-transferase CaiB-like acyl-CoA transferase
MGRSGPYVERPAYDTVGQALSGMLSQLVERQRPRIVGPAFSDGLTGLTVAYAILAALFARERTGEGQRVDVSMLEATTAFMTSEAVYYFRLGEEGGPRLRPALSQAYAFTCQDDAILAIHLSSLGKFWEGLARAVERPDLLADARFATRLDRVHHVETLQELLAAEFRKRPRADWLRILDTHDVPHAPVYTFGEVFEDPQARHLGLRLDLRHPTEGAVATVAPPVRFSATPWGELAAPPTLGQHTADILRELDLPE